MCIFFSITGNLLAETTAVFDFPEIGQTVRAKSSARFQAGGKGVNASRAAKALGFGTYAAIFPAGEDGKKCSSYLRETAKIGVIEREIAGNTRIGLVCIDSSSGIETTFLGADVPVDECAFKQILEDISLFAKRGDVLAFCGSFPDWKSHYAQKLSDFASKHGLKLCIDTYGAPLRDLIGKPAELVKINRRELYTLLDIENEADVTFEDAFESGRKICTARYFAVTDGASKSLFAEIGQKPFEVFPEVTGREVSATGCGDVALATLACGLFGRGFDFKTAATKASKIASACANSREIIPEDTSILTKIFNQ